MDASIEFNQSEKQLIAQWRSTLLHEVSLPLLLNKDPRSDHLRRFGDQLSRKAPEVKVHREHDDGIAIPAFVPHESIKFHGVPMGVELGPFLNLLSARGVSGGDYDRDNRAALSRVTLPAALTLYIAPNCPFCPKMVQMLVDLARACEPIELAIVDGVLFQDQAQKDSIRSAPTLLLEDQFRWSGMVDLTEVLDAVVNRDALHLSIASLKRMLNLGARQTPPKVDRVPYIPMLR